MREDIVPLATDPMDAHLWRTMEPVLDELVADLAAKDREAILLRFYQRKSYSDIAVALATTEEAARKRVDRATEKLRAAFEARGLKVTAAALGAVLLGNASQAATITFTTSAAAAAVAVAEGLAVGAATGGAAFAIAQQAITALAWAKLGAVATTATVGLIAVAGAVVVVVAVSSGGPNGDENKESGAGGAGVVRQSPAAPAPAGAFDAVAKPFTHDFSG